MDISQFAASLLPQAESLLRDWYPAGKQVGSEYKLGSLSGDEGESLSINTHTGLWADFATGQGGKDLLALYAARENMGQGEAAKALGWINGTGHALVVKSAPVPPEKPPADAPVPDGNLYAYRNAAGELLFYIQRTEATETERKSFRPLTWRGHKWQAKGYPAPRPLFGLELLRPDKRVLLVEGEKACLAARQLLPGYTCMTWAGGAAAVKTADWEPLYGHDVDFWPDADEAGSKAMALIASLLLPKAGTATLRILRQDGQPDGWDLADALTEGWNIERLTEHVKRPNGIHVLGLQVGKPRGDAPPIEAEKRSLHVVRAELGITTDTNGRPYQTEANALSILSNHTEFAGKIWLNEFSQQLMFDAKPLDKVRAIQILLWMQQKMEFHKLPLLAIERAALVIGSANLHHPVRDWLNGLIWDGISRLGDLMADGFGATRNDYSIAVGRCWLISMVARIYDPGCQADYMPVFEGAQGIYKSSAMRELGGEWFLDSDEDPIHNRKDFLQSLQGHWLIEIPEMHAIAGRGNGIEKIKGIITRRIDTYREPYGHKTMPYPRQCIFCGTTNQEQWNPDPTGGRRFWPIKCGHIELDYLREQREQLFAEAVTAYKTGNTWYDVPKEAAQAEQDARRERDAWEDLILSYASRQLETALTIPQILQSCLDIKPGDWTQQDQNRIARALRANGYMRVNATINNQRQWIYRRSIHIAKSQASDSF